MLLRKSWGFWLPLLGYGAAGRGLLTPCCSGGDARPTPLQHGEMPIEDTREVKANVLP